MFISGSVYHKEPCPCSVEGSGAGPFAFTIRCRSCVDDPNDPYAMAHRPDCTGVVGYGIVLPYTFPRDTKVAVIQGDTITYYDSCEDAHDTLFDELADIEFDFKWGPENRDSGLSFY